VCRKHAVSVEMKESFDDLETTMARAVEELVDRGSGRPAHRDD
jgi:hypothetical protein